MVKVIKEISAQDKILLAAKNVFLAKGMAGARMQDIADEAGINKALLHYYFRDKKKLFEMIYEEAAAQLFPKINFIFESEAPLFEKIEKFVEEYITMLLVNPFLPLFVLNEINQEPQYFQKKFWGKNKPKPEKFLKQIEKEVKQGTIRPIQPVHLLMNMISMTIFPFIAKPLFQINMALNDEQFRSAMESRKKEIPKFIIESIRK